MWQVDLKKLVTWLTPTYLRKSNVMLLQQSWNWTLRQDYNTFQMFVNAKLYRLSHNSQVCYLRAVLNDAFDFSLRRINIVDYDALQSIYLYPDQDNRDIDITGDLYMWADNFYGNSGVDFTVQIPATIVTSEADLAYLASLLAEYKTPGKNYNIQRI